MPRCRCKNPPGGGIECNQSQMAVCHVLNGQCESQCIDVPLAMLAQMRTLGFANPLVTGWLEVAMGVPLTRGFFTTSSLTIQPDGTGYFFHAGSKEMVRFALPSIVAQEELGAD